MFEKILIITDNLKQSIFFENLISELELKQSFYFGISPYSDFSLFSKNLKSTISVFDLKNKETISEIVKMYDLVLSIHCKQLFPEELIEKVKCINIHPGYNPINRGWYPQVFSIIKDTPIGATIHEIDIELDHGNIIDRVFVDKNSWDTSSDLYYKILEAEKVLLRKNIVNILNNSYLTLKPEDEGQVYYKKDFNNLKQIDLNEINTFENFFRRMRALTFDGYRNAYYIDEATNKKVYVTLKLELEN